MSSIYDDMEYPQEYTNIPDAKTSDLPVTKDIQSEKPEEEQQKLAAQIVEEQKQYEENALQALSMVGDIVTKDYLSNLTDMEIFPLDDTIIKDDPDYEPIIFKVKRMVYEKDEYSTEKFINALGAMCYADCSIFLILDGHLDHTGFYIGIQSNDKDRVSKSVADTFKSSLKGQFPGINIENCSECPLEIGQQSEAQRLLKRMNDASCVSACSGIPAYKDADGNYTNQNFVQGIEKLALAMQGKRYTAVILATNVAGNALNSVRTGYEQLYTQMSTVATQQIAYSTNESLANAYNRSRGYSDGVTDTHTTSENHSDTVNEGVSKKSGWAKAGSIIGGALAAVGGVALMATGIGAPAGLALAAVGVGGGLAAAGGAGDQKNSGKAHMDGTGSSDAHGKTHQETFQETDGQTATVGSSKNFTVTVHNKHVEEILKRIDNQLERLSLAEGTGVWASSAYFISYDDIAAAETGAAIYKSIMQGEKSGVETSAVNSWFIVKDEEGKVDDRKVKLLTNSIVNFVHPTFIFENTRLGQHVPVSASSLISTAELAMQMGLPRRSVPGFPVLEHVSLGKEVVRYSDNSDEKTMPLGCIYDQGVEHLENIVKLDVQSLTKHVFVTGSTGCGKSETVYKLISEAKNHGASFLIIEPAKGEYKKVFGKLAKNKDAIEFEHVNVFGTNPKNTYPLRINPFGFPKEIHVLEHIDRLTEIFNVCWPMYAAMPAVLKKAMLKAYENSGWDLYNSENIYTDNHDLFPSFSDLLLELEKAIESTAYSEEVKGNYIGSLLTRVESLTNGINGEIFSANELSDKVLFDEDTIIDLSRVGSQETKSLIMGILIMRLSEYRMSCAKDANSQLRHITVLEEAHNILKRTSTEQSTEGSNVAGKSVEMITNAIAEMRTFGEGFIIVDQSPTSVDPAAIKNTNTKIIMRLPDGDDRTIAGKAAGLKDSQVDEIAKLATGVAVTYQNDWEEPVLCKVMQYDGPHMEYDKQTDNLHIVNVRNSLTSIIAFLMGNRIKEGFSEAKVEQFAESIGKLSLPTQLRIQLIKLIKEYRANKTVSVWNDDRFPELSRLVTSILGLKNTVEKITENVKDFEELNEQLSRLILDKIDASESLDLNVRQCLMEDWGETNPTRRNIANVWANELRSSISKR